jgi:parallel beta-helix repeat protein
MRTKRQAACLSAFRRTPLVAALACAFIAPAALAQVSYDPFQLVVKNTSTDPSVPNSLPAAINYANQYCDTVPNPTISFAIDSGPFVISPSTQLPVIYCEGGGPYNPTIDGTTQPGWVANGKDVGFDAQLPIVLDGLGLTSGGGCAINSNIFPYGTLTLKGLEIRNFTYGGVIGVCGYALNITGSRIAGNSSGIQASAGSTIGADGNANRNVISNHFYGTAITLNGYSGTYSIVNNYIGIDDIAGTITNSPNSTGIGYSCCSEPSGTIARNVFSNTYASIDLEYDGKMTIADNKIGTDPTGTTLMSSQLGSYGISLYYSYGAQITGNVIAGQSYGIDTYQGDSVFIYGNKIGTNAAGTAPLGNETGIDAEYESGLRIENNVISGNSYEGVYLYSTTDAYVYNNRIGVDDAGGTVIANETGIYDSYAYGTRAEGNTIAGNSDTGVYLSGSQDAVITGNYIGTNAYNIGGIGNYFGVYVGGGSAQNNTFDNNTMSGNYAGAYLSDTSFATLSNNKIGTTTDGMAAVPNGVGVFAECGTNLTFNGNVISGNMYGGMFASAIQSSTFDGNDIGVTKGGGNALANGGTGIDIGPSSCGGGQFAAGQVRGGTKSAKAVTAAKSIVFGANNEPDGNFFSANRISNNSGHGVNLVGGNNNYFAQNTVSANLADGIRIDSHMGTDAYGASIVISPATGNKLLQDLVFGNAAKNINLGFDGSALPNDTDDVDGSPPDIGRPNTWQNRPVILSAVHNTQANTTDVTVQLNTGVGTYHLDLFSNPGPGAPAGRTFLSGSSPDISFTAAGTQTYTFTVGGVGDDNFSATATHLESNDTSEFADLFTATTLAVPGVTVLPTAINFGDVVVGRQSSSQAVTITSTGTAPYVVSQLRDTSCTGPAICSAGSFVCSTNCVEGQPYAANTMCTITASFAPTALGSQTKTLALCDNAAGSPRSITFSGNGVPTPLVDISMDPRTFYFGEVPVGLQSASKSFRVTNAGTTQVYLGAVRTTGDFVISGNTCGATLDAGAFCVAEVVFTPAVKGLVNGTVEVTGSNTPPAAGAVIRAKVTGPTTSNVSALLEGTGLQFGDLRLPASISFGTSVLHGSTARQTLTLANSGNGTLNISSISVSGAFVLTNPCGPTLAAGASCTISLDFSPSSLGTFNGTLTIISDAPGGSRTIALTAAVSADPRPVVRVNPVLMGFGERVIGTTSATQRVTITNEGASDAQLGTISFTQDQGQTEFSLSSTTCGASLAAQASCFADIVMKPLGFGPRNGTMLVPSNSADSPRSITLGGTGCRPFAAGGNRSGRDPCAP